MTQLSYELLEPVGGYDEGAVLDLTRRYDDWHVYDVKLEPRAAALTGSVELTWEDLRAVSKPAPARSSTEPGANRPSRESGV